MLQQTQVARVIDKFTLFVGRYPELADLAAAPIDDVLALWSGLGYYRRARLLHTAAKVIVADHAGKVPSELAALRSIPGIGPYTAGAIASMAFGQRVPLVDGNVVRVLLRIEGRDGSASEKSTMDWTWTQATSLVSHAPSPGAFNEAMMELGATVCTPRAPACGSCPLRDLCQARAEGRQLDIPRPKSKPAKRSVTHLCVVARDAHGRVLMEQRLQSGLWAGLWQPIGVEAKRAGVTSDRRALVQLLGTLGVVRSNEALRHVASFTFQTSHREVEFRIYQLSVRAAARKSITSSGNACTRWVTPQEVESLAISNAHRQVLVRAGVLEN